MEINVGNYLIYSVFDCCKNGELRRPDKEQQQEGNTQSGVAEFRSLRSPCFQLEGFQPSFEF